MICQKKPSQVGQPFVHPGQTVVQPQIIICPPWTTGCPTSNHFSGIFGVVNIPEIQSWFLKKGPVEIFPKK